MSKTYVLFGKTYTMYDPEFDKRQRDAADLLADILGDDEWIDEGLWTYTEDLIQNMFESYDDASLEDIPESMHKYIDWDKMIYEWETGRTGTIYQVNDGYIIIYQEDVWG